MNDNKSIKGLSSLNDRQLKSLMGDIASALGVDPKRAESLNVERVRTTLSTISDEEARALIDRAGKDKAEQIYKAIQRSGSNGRQA